VSSPHNPISEQLVPPTVALVPATEVSGKPGVAENPPWSGWEVAALAAITLVTMVLCILAVGYGLHSYLAPHAAWSSVITMPEVIVGGQLLAYVLLFFLMYGLVRNHTDQSVFQVLRWNWPMNPGNYLLAGFILEVCLLPFAYLLPMPKNLPLDEFFKTARDAYILSVFGIFFAPLFEELFFRGFLYPVLARRWGMGVSIVLTALFFASIHATQLKYSWGPVLVIFIVGLALTTVRAVKKSVAATVLMHMAYNGTIFVVTFFATDGFRHMERFNQ
jgi:membrane protease YdiL (CAAX protease family)